MSTLKLPEDEFEVNKDLDEVELMINEEPKNATTAGFLPQIFQNQDL